MQEHHFTVQKTARYFMLNEIRPTTRHVWWVLHGYGQLAKYFIKHFNPLAERDHVVIAPEGLSRFYLSDNWERVGASWMTKEDRLSEISDQIAYLNALQKSLYEESSGVIPFQTHVLGFSQGTATAWRWLGNSDMNVDNLVLWAGMIPPELQERISNRKGMNVHTVFGTKDPFFSEEKVTTIRNLIAESGLQAQSYTFDGEHTIDKETLNALTLQIEQNDRVLN